MFCINDEFLGTSTWRAGPTDLTAISRGGTFLGGVTDDDFVPQSRTRALSAHICLSSDKINPDRHHIDQVIDCLRREGVALINLTCEQDVDTKYLMSIAEAMGTPLSHSDTIGPVWDVRSQGAPGGIDSGSRSHGMDEFEWHTDCSYENPPPRFFGLQVLQADRLGGGKLKVHPVEAFVSKLSPQTMEAMQTDSFSVKVPEEFSKGGAEASKTIKTSLLRKDLHTSHWLLKYRDDITEGVTEDARDALREVRQVLTTLNSDPAIKLLGADVLKGNTVIILDNARWLHARTKPKDPERWLRRVRWHVDESVFQK